MVCLCQASPVPLEMNNVPQRFFFLMVAIFGERRGGGGEESVVYNQPKLFDLPITLKVGGIAKALPFDVGSFQNLHVTKSLAKRKVPQVYLTTFLFRKYQHIGLFDHLKINLKELQSSTAP